MTIQYDIRTERRDLFPSVLDTENSTIRNGKVVFAGSETYHESKTVEEKSQMVIDSLLGLDSTFVVSLEDINGSRTILKGSGFCRALSDFLQNRFKLTGLHFFKEYEGKTFDDILPIHQSKLEDTTVRELVIQPPTSTKIIQNKLKNIDIDLTIKEIENLIKKNG